VAETPASSTKASTPAKGTKNAGVIARMMLFIRQVVGELRKVTTPTRKELFRYTTVVLMFVVVMMVLVTLLDLAFGTATAFIFGGGNGDS
jgi:preprotein translocase subunit SecE